MKQDGVDWGAIQAEQGKHPEYLEPGGDEFWARAAEAQGGHPARFPKDIGFFEGLTTKKTGQPKYLQDWIPFLRSMEEGDNLAELSEALEAKHAGTATEYQEDLVELASIHRYAMENSGLAPQIGSAVGESAMFMGEFAAVSAIPGLGPAAKAGQAANAGRAARVLGGLGRGIVQGTKLQAAKEALMLPTGAGDLRNEVLERTMRGYGYAENEAGELAIQLSDARATVLDVLPESVVATLMEPISERSGAGLSAAGIDKLDGVIGALFARFRLRNPGAGAKGFGQALREAASVGGFAEELAEEFYAGAVQEGLAVAMPGTFEGLKGSLMTESDEILTTMATVGIIQGGFGAANALGSIPTPENPGAGFEGLNELEQPNALTAEEAAALEGLGRERTPAPEEGSDGAAEPESESVDSSEPAGPGNADVSQKQEPDPAVEQFKVPDDARRAVEEEAAQLGQTIEWGGDLPEGTQGRHRSGDQVVQLAETLEPGSGANSLYAAWKHEEYHALAAEAPDVADAFAAWAEENLPPELMEAAREQYRADMQAAGVEFHVEHLREEAIASVVEQQLAPLLHFATTAPEGRQVLEGIARQTGLWERLLGWLKRLVGGRAAGDVELEGARAFLAEQGADPSLASRAPAAAALAYQTALEQGRTALERRVDASVTPEAAEVPEDAVELLRTLNEEAGVVDASSDDSATQQTDQSDEAQAEFEGAMEAAADAKAFPTPDVRPNEPNAEIEPEGAEKAVRKPSDRTQTQVEQAEQAEQVKQPTQDENDQPEAPAEPPAEDNQEQAEEATDAGDRDDVRDAAEGAAAAPAEGGAEEGGGGAGDPGPDGGALDLVKGAPDEGEGLPEGGAAAPDDRGEREGDGGEPAPRGDREPVRADDPGSDYLITEADELGKGGAKTKARQNIAAIRLLHQLEAEDRLPTTDEQAVLVKYVGWGATELAQGVFPSGEPKKGWGALAKEVRELLTEDEWSAAARSTQYAHYTSKEVIDGIYTALRTMGFEGGRVLEPGMGVGHFMGLMPPHLRDASSYTGIEIDPTSARIAAKLYPGQDVRLGDFREFKRPDGYYDVAIGNPPFSSTRVQGAESKYKGLHLHDYFAMKMLDLVRPGGLVAFVTSKGTMDKVSKDARARMAQRADLVGAFRLPQTAFKENAGTEVVTDVLLFVRKPHDSQVDTSWVETAETTVQGAAYQINEYFLANRSNLLGTPAMEGTMYSANAFTLKPKRGVSSNAEQLGATLREKAEALPSVYVDRQPSRAQENTPRTEFAAESLKPGAYYLDSSGSLMQKLEDGTGREVTTGKKADGGLPKTKQRVVSDYVPLRDAVRATLAANLEGSDADLATAQKALKRQYEAFVKKHGPINRAKRGARTDRKTGDTVETLSCPTVAALSQDPDAYLVAAIENVDEETDQVSPADIFSKRVIAQESAPSISTTQDALNVVLSQHGRVDMEEVASLRGLTVDQAVAELGTAIYQEPVSDLWQTADEYLSGNVRQKLRTAESLVGERPELQRNVEALRDAQPADLKPSEITVRPGMSWIPSKYVETFIHKVLAARAARVHFTPGLNEWRVDADSWDMRGAESVRTFGTERYPAPRLFEALLQSRPIEVVDYVQEGGKRKAVKNKRETLAAQDKADRLRERFEAWVWEDADRASDLAGIYNERYNSTVPRQFDGSHLTLPGQSAKFDLHPWQRRAVWRAIQTGNLYMAHTVGAGKTMAMVSIGMEERRLGISKKPMYVVPNHMLHQFSVELLELYPTAEILVADEQQFHKSRRKAFVAKVSTGNWDAVIITHSAFKYVPVSPDFERGFIQDEISEYESILQQTNDRTSRKLLEAAKEKLKERLGAMTKSMAKDDGPTFEETGIDRLIVDEAHEFRKLQFPTKTRGIKGIDSKGSQMAWDLYMKSRYLEKQRPGRSMVLASGTPVTNTMGELFTLQRFLQKPALDALGLSSFDSWASQYGDTKTSLERGPSGNYALVSRFVQFHNLPELQRSVLEVADVVRPDDLAAKLSTRPKVRGGSRSIVLGEKSDDMAAYEQELGKRIEAIEARKGPPQKGDDIILSVINDGRHAAIDMRFVDRGAAPDPENKLSKLIDQVWKVYQDHQEDRAAQVVFAELGTPSIAAKRGFSAYTWIRDELVSRGVPASEIAFAQDAKSHEDKARLFAKVRSGDVRVLIGGKGIEKGMNVQKRLRALHHLDAPWLPSSMEQREGRILRQGNQFPEVDIYAYATKGSYDATMWQILENKARMIDAFWSGGGVGRTMEDVSIQADGFATAKALADSNPLVLELAQLEQELSKLRGLAGAHRDEQFGVRQDVKRLTEGLVHDQQLLDDLKASADREPGEMPGDEFEVTIEGNTYGDRKSAGAAALKVIARGSRFDGTTTQPANGALGLVGDVVISWRTHGLDDHAWITAEGQGAASVEFDLNLLADNNPVGLARRIVNAANGFSGKVEGQEALVARNQEKLAKSKKLVGAEFDRAGELKEKEARAEQIKGTLKAQSEPERPEESFAPRRNKPLTDFLSDATYYDWLGRRQEADEEVNADAGTKERELRRIAGRRSFETFLRETFSKEPSHVHVRNLDQALLLYIDLKGRAEEEYAKYGEGLSARHRYIYDLSQNLSPELRALGDRIADENRRFGESAAADGLIGNVIDNYIARTWKGDPEQQPSYAPGMPAKFRTHSRHQKARVLSSVLQGWALGKELEIPGAIEAQRASRQQLNQVREDRALIKKGMEVGLLKKTRAEGFEPIEHPNFRQWVYVGKVDPESAEMRDRDTIVTQSGAVLQRVPLYAKKDLAVALNRALGTSRLGLDVVTKYNAQLKSWTLFTSLFHHFAFLRSYMLGTPGLVNSLRVGKAYTEGLSALEEFGPDVRMLVHEGLTIGRTQDLDPGLQEQKTIIGATIDRLPIAGNLKAALFKLRDQQLNFLFHRLGPALKTSAAIYELNHLRHKYRRQLESGAMSQERLSEITAAHVNADFGGLNLQRMKRSPTAQHVTRLLLLAPDWTESNLLTVTKLLKGNRDSTHRSQDEVERRVYAAMWGRVFARYGAMLIAFNMMMAALDDEETFWSMQSKAWRSGRLRWMDADVTPIYRALGGDPDRRKYLNLAGHFKDPVKWAIEPAKSLSHKGSVLTGMVTEAALGTDWRGHRFTTAAELFGVDDKGRYKRSGDGHRRGDPKGGKLAGQATTWDFQGGKMLSWDTMPSFVYHQATEMHPVQVQNLSAFLAGEIDGFDALIRSIGLQVSTARESE